MMIVKTDKTLLVGRDFLNATTGRYTSHGLLTVSGHTYDWKATYPVIEAEHYLRSAVTKEGKHVSFFQSQAI
jgi:hypothetical protein